MKITPEHLAHMRAAIAATIPVHPYTAADYARAGHSPKRYRWDLLYAAKLTPWICQHLYKYCNDEHIDTALRAILAELQPVPDAPQTPGVPAHLVRVPDVNYTDRAYLVARKDIAGTRTQLPLYMPDGSKLCDWYELHDGGTKGRATTVHRANLKPRELLAEGAPQ